MITFAPTSSTTEDEESTINPTWNCRAIRGGVHYRDPCAFGLDPFRLRMEPNTMNCAVPTANTIAQCAGTVNVGELTTGSTYVLRVVNVASSKTEYVVGNTDEIVIAGFDFSPGSVYALSLTNGTFKPYIDESTVGTTEVEMIYVKVDKVFNTDGTIYAPAEQWIILPQ